MLINKIKTGRIKIKITILQPDKLINILWKSNINVYKMKKDNQATVVLWIEYVDYEKVYNIVTHLGGKIKILKQKGSIFNLKKIKNKSSIAVGMVLFFIVLFFLSRNIWSIEIEVGKNIAPFEIREQLKSIGVKSGVSKSKVDTKEIEKSLEKINSEILWIRARVEGSTLKVKIEEKINPPNQENLKYGNLVATAEGEIKSIYTYDGRSAVKVGDLVSVGDVLIEGIDGKEEQEYLVEPRGIVNANIFYEKEIQIKLNDIKLERSGNIDKDIYIEIFGKKLYLKKNAESFDNYDKVEIGGKIFNEVLYYERVEKEVNLEEKEAIEVALKDLEEELRQELKRDAKITDRKFTKKKDEEGKITLKVVFIVEKNIVNDIPVKY